MQAYACMHMCTAGIKAIRLILEEPGLTTAKVSILVGGPDWPTSVLTGILKLPAAGMQIGTLPVPTPILIPILIKLLIPILILILNNTNTNTGNRNKTNTKANTKTNTNTRCLCPLP